MKKNLGMPKFFVLRAARYATGSLGIKDDLINAGAT
jgi:hypothetical protein